MNGRIFDSVSLVAQTHAAVNQGVNYIPITSDGGAGIGYRIERHSDGVVVGWAILAPDFDAQRASVRLILTGDIDES